jgi:hypothetical protein
LGSAIAIGVHYLLQGFTNDFRLLRDYVEDPKELFLMILGDILRIYKTMKGISYIEPNKHLSYPKAIAESTCRPSSMF